MLGTGGKSSIAELFEACGVELPDLPNKESCERCGKSSSESLKKCSKCMSVYYCSTLCQTPHWKIHKLNCKSVEDVKKEFLKEFIAEIEESFTINVEDVEKFQTAIDMIFPVVSYERSRARHLLHILCNPFFLTQLSSTKDLKDLLSLKGFTEKLMRQVLDVLGCIHSIHTKSTEAMEAKERQISKLVDFRNQQCQLLRNALLRSSFGSSTVLKTEENAHWERVLTHKETGKGIALVEWLELITTIADLNISQTNKFFDQPLFFMGEKPAMWTNDTFTMRTFIQYLWWEVHWLREQPDLKPEDREAQMHQHEEEEDDDDDEGGGGGGERNKRQKIPGNHNNKNNNKNIKTSLQLRDELIDFEKKRHLTRRMACFKDGHWEGSHMWLPADLFRENYGVLPENKIAALMKVQRIDPQVAKSVNYSFDMICINRE